MSLEPRASSERKQICVHVCAYTSYCKNYRACSLKSHYISWSQFRPVINTWTHEEKRGENQEEWTENPSAVQNKCYKSSNVQALSSSTKARTILPWFLHLGSSVLENCVSRGQPTYQSTSISERDYLPVEETHALGVIFLDGCWWWRLTSNVVTRLWQRKAT